MTKLANTFVVYQGHHGDQGASIADVILPGCAYTEKDGTYVNTEGRVQNANKAVAPPGEAKEDWKIIRALSEKMGCMLDYDSIQELRRRLVKQNSIFKTLNEIVVDDFIFSGSGQTISSLPFKYPIDNYYQTDVISRASRTMAKCTKDFVLLKSKKVIN